MRRAQEQRAAEPPTMEASVDGEATEPEHRHVVAGVALFRQRGRAREARVARLRQAVEAQAQQLERRADIEVVLVEARLGRLDEVLVELGVSPAGAGGDPQDGNRVQSSPGSLPVLLDGRVVGGGSVRDLKRVVASLRLMKVADRPQIPPTLEVAFFPPSPSGSGPFPGLYLFTGSARVIRPVLQRASGKVEMIGSMEQPFMDIACLPDDVREGVTTHMEVDPTNMLSLVASMTPFSDYNQSPRNMYQVRRL